MLKKLIFLLLTMVFFIFIFVLASTAAIANEAVRNRDGPVFVITAIQPEITKIVIAKALIIAPNSAPVSNSAMEAWAQIANGTESNMSFTRLVTANTVVIVRLPFTIVPTDVHVRPMKLPILQDSGRKIAHLTIANCGRISYHHRA